MQKQEYVFGGPKLKSIVLRFECVRFLYTNLTNTKAKQHTSRTINRIIYAYIKRFIVNWD